MDKYPIISRYEFLGKFSDPPFEICARYDKFEKLSPSNFGYDLQKVYLVVTKVF